MTTSGGLEGTRTAKVIGERTTKKCKKCGMEVSICIITVVGHTDFILAHANMKGTTRYRRRKL